MDEVALREILATGNGDRWLEIENEASALYAGRISETAVGYFYNREALAEGGRIPGDGSFWLGPTRLEQLSAKFRSACFLTTR